MLFISDKLFKKIKYIILLLITLIILFWIYGHKDNILRHFYPTKYSEYVNKYSNQYNIDPYLVYSIIRVESDFDPGAESRAGAKGLMQITDGTGEWVAKQLKLKNYDKSLLFEPEFNIMIGCWYLDNLTKQFDGKAMLALTAYNAGSGNVQKWLKDKELSSDGEFLDNIPYGETKRYVTNIKKDYSVYKSLYSK